ncbi:hypothetical protein WA026_014969 [Henosepilachna vigintioctopunctata]
MLSTFKNKPMENYTHIHLESLQNYREFQKNATQSKDKNSIFRIYNYILEMSEIFWNDDNIRKIIREKPKYDVIIMISFCNDGALGIGHHLEIPVVLLNPIGSTSLANSYLANPNMAYIPNPVITRSADNFFGRLVAVTMNAVIAFLIRTLIDPYQQDIMRKYLPNSPPIWELQNNVSLMLVNSHFSVEPARPYVPNMIPIGGFHLDIVEEMSENMRIWLDNADNGAILFCLGSTISISSIEKEKLLAIIKVLGEMAPMKVIFKSEVDIENIPSNILVEKWLPQAAILAHPNMKLLICHGGLNSNIESVFYGVPMLGIPFFGDQTLNIEEAQKAGYGVLLEKKYITEETFRMKIQEIVNNPQYTLNAKKKSALMREQPVKPMDNAIFWIEHIIEFGEGSHLKNNGIGLAWYELYMLDIYCFFLGFTLLFLISIYFMTKIFMRILKICMKRLYSRTTKLKIKKEN